MGTDRRLLVTGAGGQLGRAFRRIAPEAVLLNRGALDVTDESAVREQISEHRPDVVIHAAAYTNVDLAEEDAAGAETVNVKGTQTVASVTREIGALLVYPSSDYVFDGTKRTYKEEDETGPLSVYGRTKLEGERIVQNFPHLIVRTSWVFGHGRNFIRSILGVASGGELTVVDDQRGRPTYAIDLAEGILQLLNVGARGVYHLAGAGDACTWADLAEYALETAGLTSKVKRVTSLEYLDSREGTVAPRPANSVLDCSKAESLGVTLRPWPEAVADYIKEIA